MQAARAGAGAQQAPAHGEQLPGEPPAGLARAGVAEPGTAGSTLHTAARALPATLNQLLAPPPAHRVPERRPGLCSQRALKVTHPQSVCSVTGPPSPGVGFSSRRV